MWEINIGHQVFSFLISLAAGTVMCLFFDILRAFRWHFRIGRAGVFLLDVFYFVVMGIATFCLFLGLTGGQLRGFVFIGEAAGFAICRVTLSGFFFKFVKAIFIGFSFTTKLFLKWIIAPLKSFLSKTRTFFKKLLTKLPLFKKKGLKNDDSVVYTKEKMRQ